MIDSMARPAQQSAWLADRRVELPKGRIARHYLDITAMIDEEEPDS
jgi:hypothetical protein